MKRPNKMPTGNFNLTDRESDGVISHILYTKLLLVYLLTPTEEQ